MAAPYAQALRSRQPSARELQHAHLSPPLLIMANAQEHAGLRYRVVRSLTYLDLANQMIGPTSVRGQTEQGLAYAFHTLLTRVREQLRQRNFVGPVMPIHARFRMEAIEYSPHAGEGPRPFWASLTISITDWVQALQQITQQIAARYSDDGYLDELGSDHDTQNLTYIARIDCEMLLQNATNLGGGCGTSNHETWKQSLAEDKHFFRVLPVRAKNNNCGIACLVQYGLRGGWMMTQRIKYDDMRRELGIQQNSLLTYAEMDKVATRCATNYQIWDIDGSKRHYFEGYPDDKGRCANLLCDQGHYTLILAQVGVCLCGKPDGEGHTCKFKGGFCENCQTHHPNMAHDCPYRDANVAARAVQDLAADQLRRQQAARDAAVQDRLNTILTGMDNRDDFEPILECVFKLKRSCLVLGPGGVGKTFIALKEVRGVIEDGGGKVKIFTPTGQAATLTPDATTAHYALKLRTGTDSLDCVLKRFKDVDYADWEDVTHILLDEISMFDGPTADLIDAVVRQLKRKPTEPFGGCVVVGVGDFLQLKPIGTQHLFFDAEIVRSMLDSKTLGVYYLTKPVRYPCVKWFDLLCRVRIGKPNTGDVNRLRMRLKTLDEWCEEKGWTEQTMPVLACPKNKEADDFNERCANMLKAQGKQTHRFMRETRKAGKQLRPSDLEKLAPHSVTLMIDAKVMLLVNMSRGKCKTNYLEEHGVGNGSVGWVHAFGTPDDPGVLVRFRGGAEVFVGYHSFEDTVCQIPLRLAYASSIHKLQGASLDEALLSLGGCFCEAQAYAALSRVCREENCYIVSLNVNALKRIDRRCLAMSLPSTQKPLPRLEISDEGAWVDPNDVTPYMRARMHSVPKGDSLVTSKVIYFDAETFHNSKGELECYHMEVIKVCHGVGASVNWTKRDDDNDVLHDFSTWVTETILRDVQSYVGRTVMSAQKKWLEKPWILAAYNGANFDFHILIKYLFQGGLTNDFKVNLMMKGNTVAYFDLWHTPSGKQCFVFHDLCRLLQCSLAKASKDMLGVNLKGLFPHRHMNRAGWTAVAHDEQPRFVRRDDFFEKDYEALDALFGHPDEVIEHFPVVTDVVFDEQKKFVSAKINLRACLMHYGASDVQILRQLYHKVDGVVTHTFNASVMNFYSANQLSRYGVMRHLPRVARLLRTEPTPGHAKFIESQLFCLPKEMDTWVSEAMFGGRTLPRQTHFKSAHIGYQDIADYGMRVEAPDPTTLVFRCLPGCDDEFYSSTDALCFFDIFSMYVSIMKDMEFSFGKPHWMTDDELSPLRECMVGAAPFALVLTRDALGNVIGGTHDFAEQLISGEHGHFVLDIDIMGHPYDVEPPVPYRGEGRGHHGKVLWDTKRRRGKYTHVDIGLMLRNGGRVFAIHGGIRWPFKGKIFEEYMNTTLAWKQEGETTGNEALRSFGKLCGNTVFGGMCMRTHTSAVAMCLNDAEVELFLKENTWEGAYSYREGLLIWGKRKSIDDAGIGVQVYSPTAKQIGCLVLSYARNVVDTFCNAANPRRRRLMQTDPTHEEFERMQLQALKAQPYYGDTDSLIIHCRQYANVKHLLKDAPGFWTDDLNKKWECASDYGREAPPVRTLALIFEYYGAAPKSYALKYVTPVVRPATDIDYLFCDLTDPNDPALDDFPPDGWQVVSYNLEAQKEKLKFKGVPKSVPVSVDGTVYSQMSLGLLRTLMVSGISQMDADEEILPTVDERPQIDLSSIGKVGFKPTAKDYFTGIAPFSLKPVSIRRTLFQTRFSGRKVAYRRTVPASRLMNDILAPLSMPIGRLI